MPRRPRQATSEFIFHVLNRGIQGLVVFEQAGDFDAFLSLVKQASTRFSVRILSYVVMPTHWHLVVWPVDDGGLSAFMQWLTGTHARRWRENRGNTGRGAVYQSRYKAIAVQRDGHFLTVCHYVECNPPRARLVARAEDWPWSSASPHAQDADRPVLTPWPVPKPEDWLEQLNVPEARGVLEELRTAVRLGRPFGNVTWRSATIRRLPWDIPCRKPGRPAATSHAPRPARLFG